MTKTFIPAALFGISSTALLTIGLSSLYTTGQLYAHYGDPATRSLLTSDTHYEDLSARPMVASEYGGWSPSVEQAELPEDANWTAGDDTESGKESSNSAGLMNNDATNCPAEINEAGQNRVRDIALKSYCYYYRFVAQDVWAENGCEQFPNDDTLAVAAEGTYNFVDEYSSEEAARYEMAQESRSAESLDQFVAGTEEVAGTEASERWSSYEKYYFYIDPEDYVGVKPSLESLQQELACQRSDDSAGDGWRPAQRFITVAELEELIQAELGESYRQPDYEADVAAAWLFAGKMDAATAVVHTEDAAADKTVENTAGDNWMPSTEATDASGAEDRFSLSEAEASEENQWTIINPEPIVGTPWQSSAEASAQTANEPFVTDTPWHGEPGEEFSWPDDDEDARYYDDADYSPDYVKDYSPDYAAGEGSYYLDARQPVGSQPEIGDGERSVQEGQNGAAQSAGAQEQAVSLARIMQGLVEGLCSPLPYCRSAN